MHSIDAVLLPDVFSRELVKLGHILRNPLEPTVRNFIPSDEALKDAALEKSEEHPTEPFHATVALDRKGSFSVNFTRFLGVGASGEHSDFLEIEAEKLTEQSFVNADAALAKICRGNTALEEWIKPFAVHRKPVYFVIGIQTLHKAKFRRAIGKGSAVEAYAKIPVDASAQMPVNVRAQLTRGGTGTSEGTVSGVFGLKVLKGTWSIFKATELPSWEGKPYWTWVYERKGGADVEKLTGLGLHEMDQSDLEELQKERWSNEEEDAEDDDTEDDDA